MNRREYQEKAEELKKVLETQAPFLDWKVQGINLDDHVEKEDMASSIMRAETKFEAFGKNHQIFGVAITFSWKEVAAVDGLENLIKMHLESHVHSLAKLIMLGK